MTIVSRLRLDHPALGTTGGTALHASVEDLYEKIGDSMNSRFFTSTLTNGATADFEHGFNAPFAELRYELYDYNAGTGALTRINPTTGFTIVATPGQTTTHIRVGNASGGTRTIALIVVQDPINLDELEDVFITSPASGDLLQYNGSAWVNGANLVGPKVVQGTTDVVQFRINGNATQTVNPNVFEIRNSANAIMASINNTGTLTLAANITAPGSIATGGVTASTATAFGPGYTLSYTGSGSQSWTMLTKGTSNTTGGATNDLVVFDGTGTVTAAVFSSGATNKGIVSFPEQSGVYAAITANVAASTYAHNSNQKILFQDNATAPNANLSNGYDQRGNWDNTNSNFTVPVSGRYLITSCLRILSSANMTLILMQLFRNGSAFRDLTLLQGSFPSGTEPNGMTVANLTAGWVIDLRAQVQVTGTGTWGLEIADGGSPATWITIDKIG